MVETTTQQTKYLCGYIVEYKDVKGCPVPWYYWIISLIAVLMAILITMTIFLIKLKR